MQKIKLIWDFKGEDALGTAQHHSVHLKEFVNSKKIDYQEINFEKRNHLHAIAYLVIFREDMIICRDLLKPHRATTA